MKECIFCNWNLIKEDVLYQTENFFVKVGIGIISAGHVMVIPKKHYYCYAEMPEELFSEYEQLKEKIKKFITEKFSEPLLAEYGVWEQSVNHAHTHLIPLKAEDYEVFDVVSELSQLNDKVPEDYSIEKMRRLFEREGGYAYFEERGKSYLFSYDGKLKGEFCFCHRPYFAKKGVKGVLNYHNLNDEEKVKDEQKRNKTKEVFRKYFKL
ncbi:MAG: HIT family protein [Nanoarchaeota archaeon]|nr:HIT family protein [Nanoarchaeota archaeon]MBU1644386.1 HIT family protein [Nanoarchaeota archaeon]MBU1976427.1 HIT family protein [Nanoarchaeota archaeon]